MVRFCVDVLLRAFTDSLARFEQNPRLLLLCVLGAIITAILALVFRGREAFVEHMKANVAIAFGGAILTWMLVFLWTLAWMPNNIRIKAEMQPLPTVKPMLPPAIWDTRNNPTSRLASRQADSTTTGFLRSLPRHVSIDPQLPHSVTVNFTIDNIGALQLLPEALTLVYVRIRPEMSAKKEDEFFSTMNLGGGAVSFKDTENNYWEPREMPKEGSVTENLPLSGDDPQALLESGQKAFEDLQNGKIAIYFFARHGFKDKFGFLATESCYLWKGPPPFYMSQCHGHNGPADWPKIKRR